MSDLSERLRGNYVTGLGDRRDFSPYVPNICKEAADRLDELEAENQSLKDQLEKAREDSRKAQLWDAFMNQGRIRILGWAKLGEIGYQHMGFEIWTQYGKDGEYDFTEENEEARKHIETYMDAWIKTLQQEGKS